MTEGPGWVNSIVRALRLGQTGCMKHALVAIALVLSSCGPVAMYYREGVSVSRLDTDRTRCEVEALKDAPVANQVRQNPPIFIPGNRVCNAAGACYYEPGYWVGGGIYTVDVNADLRGRVMDMCMAGKGYQPVSLPRCTQAVKSAAVPQATVQLPRLTESTCVIVNDNGTWQIVNPVRATSAG